MPLHGITPGNSWLGGHFFEGLQNFMKNKSEGNENKNFALSKFIVNSGLEDLWRRENPDFSDFIGYDISSCTNSGTDRVYTDIKIAPNSKINHIMVSFTDHYNANSFDFPQKLKLEKINGTLISLL